jgi:hypothetical protein
MGRSIRARCVARPRIASGRWIAPEIALRPPELCPAARDAEHSAVSNVATAFGIAEAGHRYQLFTTASSRPGIANPVGELAHNLHGPARDVTIVIEIKQIILVAVERDHSRVASELLRLATRYCR